MDLLIPSFGLIFWSLFWLVLWLVALVDVLRNNFNGQNEKLIWVLVIVFIPFLGPILYFIIGRKHRIKLN